MSSLDTYRRNIDHKNEEVARLQQQKANERRKTATLADKILTLSQSIQRTKNPSIISSKQHEIERYEKERTSIEKKIGDLEIKIARKQKEISDEQKKLLREEQTVHKKQIAQAERQTQEYKSQLDNMSHTIRQHDSWQRETTSILDRLQSLPENITVLFLASNPIDQQPLRLDEEARSIAEMIRKAKHRDSVKLETRWAIRPVDVLQAINELNPTIVHFSGHGTDTDEILFQDANGTAKMVSKEALVQMMMASTENIRLVFFNTCYSFNQAEALTKHVEAAIGMNSSIGDEAARIFSSQFYSAIGFGLSVRKAFDQAKAMVMMEGIPEENTPQLFVQAGLDAHEIVIVRP